MSLEGPNSDDREAIEGLRAAFERAGFTLPAVERLLGLGDLFDRRPRDEPLYRRRAAGDGVNAANQLLAPVRRRTTSPPHPIRSIPSSRK